MDPVSSSPTLGIEFGLLPRTPASSRSKNGRTPNGKENSQSGGSLHQRLFNTFRSKSRSRSRSLTRASDDGSPGSKPVRRRKSIVDLLNLSSRESHDDSPAANQVNCTDTGTSKGNDETHAEPFSNMPKRRRSFGNLLSSMNIMGTITNRVSQKPIPARQESLVRDEPSIVRTTQMLDLRKLKTFHEKQVKTFQDSTTEKNKSGTGPLYVKLAEGSAVDIDLFESRMARILDDIVADRPEENSGYDSSNSYLRLLQEACDEPSEKNRSWSPNSLRPILSHPRSRKYDTSHTDTMDPVVPLSENLGANTAEENLPKTPDSYLRLLIDSSGEPTQDNQLLPLNSTIQLSEASPIPCHQDSDDGINTIKPTRDGIKTRSVSPIVPLQSCLRNHRYEVRDTTPDPCADKELSRQNVHDQRPTVIVREVSQSSTLIDLDPEFCQRQEERAERYAGLGLAEKSTWKSNQEEISQRIVSTVARMTRNYHALSDDSASCSPSKETTQHEDDNNLSIRCFGTSFEVDANETWDSVTIGRNLLLQDKFRGQEESMDSGDAARLLTPLDETSLPELDELSTMPGSSDSTREILSHLSAEEILLPFAEEVLQDSAMLRSPLEPFGSIRGPPKMDSSLDLDKEIDFCPEYESFLRRSQGVLDSTPSILPPREMWPQRYKPNDEGTQVQLPVLGGKSRQASYSTVKVRYPGTVNLLRHTENFPSMRDALLGLYNYKLGDLSNFFVYDAGNRTIDAQLIDSPVPNPADLKIKGLQLGWIPQLSKITTTNTVGDVLITAESSHHSKRRSSLCDSGWEDFTFESARHLDEPDHDAQWKMEKISCPSVLDATGHHERAMSAINSVFDDDFFLEDQSGSGFSEQVSVFDDSPAMNALRAAASEEETAVPLDFEDKLRATKTWAELAGEATDSSPEEAVRDEGYTEIPNRYGPFTVDPLQQNIHPNIHYNGSQYDDSDGNGGLCDIFDTPIDSQSGLEGLEDQGGRQSDPENSQDLADSISSNQLISRDPTAQATPLRQPSATLEAIIDHSPGYHFTVVKEHLMEDSEEFENGSSAALEHAFEVLFDAAENIESDNSLHDEDAAQISGGIAETTAAAEVAFYDPIRNEGSHAVDRSKRSGLGESYPNSLGLPALDFATKPNFSPSAAKNIEQGNFQKNEDGLTNENLPPVDEAARPSPSSKKSKSKIEALVNVFQDHGIMPVTSRGPLHMSSISPSYSHQTSRYRGESSGTSVGAGTVRRISATLSTGSLYAPSPVNRLGTPCSTFDRPHSRFSDIDTEASFQFGEVLKRTRKHGEGEKEDRDAEMYG